MANSQTGILAEVPRIARHLEFVLLPGRDARTAIERVASLAVDESIVVGVGQPLVKALTKDIEGLRGFPHFTGSGFSVPSTQSALWLWLRGSDRGELVHQTRALRDQLDRVFTESSVVDAFQFRDSRDLTGYKDGTENPTGDKAREAAIVAGGGRGLDGSSFVAVQTWQHDLSVFQAMNRTDQDHTFGRSFSDDEELDDAPASAHVKRTAQESFEPEAFVVRRSMPWSDGRREGLVFVAFGRSLDPFEAQLRRMTGAEDGISDALFRFTRPLSGSYFWCPPLADGKLDLQLLL